MFAGALMAAYSQQACATRTHSRMREVGGVGEAVGGGGAAGPAASRRPDSFSCPPMDPFTPLTAVARVAGRAPPLEPLVCCKRIVK